MPRPDLRRTFVNAVLRHPLMAARQLTPWMSKTDRYLRAVLLALTPRVVHVGSAESLFTWATPAAQVGARVVTSFHGEESLSGPEAPGDWHAVWDASHAVVTETAALAETAYRLGAPERAVAIVPPIPERVSAAPEARPANEPLHVLSKGPLSWAQGYEHSLQAIRFLADEGVQCSYRIVGTGDFIDAIGFARHQLGIEDLTEVRDGAETRPGEHLSWARVLVDPAVVPTSPRTIFSALARGLPVVTTQPPPGAEDAVLPVPRRDPRALADALGALARGPELYRRLAEGGLAFTQARQGRDDGVGELVRLYRSLGRTTDGTTAGRRPETMSS
jgi:glycosyltransferase involved in cell wall biosynthesis